MRDESGKRSTIQPTGIEKTTYTMEEYMKKSETQEAERRKGGAESLCSGEDKGEVHGLDASVWEGRLCGSVGEAPARGEVQQLPLA